MNLNNKVILITGASDGLGKQISLKLAKENTILALLGRNQEKLELVRDESKKLGAKKVEIYSCDIRNLSELKDTFIKIKNDFGKVDILINNAGIWQKLSPAEEITDETVDDVIKTNLVAQIELTNLVLPILKEQKEAAIINIISQSGIVAQEGQSVYTASKFGMRGFSEVLKVELEKSNVRVANICQSGVDTKMFDKTGEKVPNEIFTNPADLADVVVFMLSRPEKIWLHEVWVKF